MSLFLYHTSQHLLSDAFLSAGFFAVLFSLGILVFHRHAISKARSLILDDKAKYNEIWAGIISNAEDFNQLQILKLHAQCILGSLVGPPRQINREYKRLDESPIIEDTDPSNLIPKNEFVASLHTQWTESFQLSEEEKQLLGCGMPGTLDIRFPVDSLDQLYYQAAAVHPILISMVQKWASVSQGCFQAATPGFVQTNYPRFFNKSSDRMLFCARKLLSVRVNPDSQMTGSAPEMAETLPPGLVAWEAVRDQELMLTGQVKWCSLKSVQRSLEKSTRSYSKVKITLLLK